MIFLLAKVVQLMGLLTVGYGFYLGLKLEQGMVEELRLLLAGSCIFMAGWFLQKKGES